MGNPNCGKSALFNRLTHSHTPVANYTGVTVEKIQACGKGSLAEAVFIDLPGVYSAVKFTPDEQITFEVLEQLARGAGLQSLRVVLIVVCNAMDCERGFALALELYRWGFPMLGVLNMHDEVFKANGLIDTKGLTAAFGFDWIASSAILPSGLDGLVQKLEQWCKQDFGKEAKIHKPDPLGASSYQEFYQKADLFSEQFVKVTRSKKVTRLLDQIILHPLVGSLCMLFLGIVVFQAVFNWAQIPMDAVEDSVQWVSQLALEWLPSGPLRGLLIHGILAGAGAVAVFLPQILILFGVIYFLEELGFLPRIAFLVDILMRAVGLNGRAFLPLISSFACAIPGILATRTIENRCQRLITMWIAPLIPCAAKLPVYSLLIAAFVPNLEVFWGLKLRGLVLFGLYFLGVLSAFLVGFILSQFYFKQTQQTFMLELPDYRIPRLKRLGGQLWLRAQDFVFQTGGLIVAVSVILWFLSSHPAEPILESYVGRLGLWLEPFVAPLGFNWKIAVALIPGFAAREVVIGSLATVYGVANAVPASSSVGHMTQSLGAALQADLGLAAGLSLLIFYVFALQCGSTVAVLKKESGSWKVAASSFGVMSLMAYSASWMTYRIVGRIWGL